MSIIKFLLPSGFTALLIYYVFHIDTYRMRASQKILGILFFGLAFIAILFPETLNSLAHVLGIGRGADLLLYSLTLAFLFSVLNFYMNTRKLNLQITALARKISILEADINLASPTKPKNKS